MAEFSWVPLDFLDALEVIPKIEEHEISYRYVVERKPLRLELTIWPLDRDVELALMVEEMAEPVICLKLLDCPGARVVDDKRGKFIEFSAANLFTGRYDTTRPAPYGFRLQLQPQLQVTPFCYDM